MAFKMKYKNLKQVVKELKAAVKAHGRQAKVVESHIKDMKKKQVMAYKMKRKKKSPCWKGYEMIGMKKKGGRKVPNCVPKKKKK